VHVSVFDNKRASLYAWQDRVRNPRLTAVLTLQLFLMFSPCGNGDIVPLNPFARSLANLESVIGQFDRRSHCLTASL
jgi:hypothetical protein